MIKKIIITLIILGVAYCIYSPIVIPLGEVKNTEEFNFSVNDIFNLKKIIKNDSKNYKAYIILNYEELEYLSPKIIKSKVLISSNVDVIDELMNCKFKYTGGDASTIESKIYICSDDGLIFESEISLDANSKGLQNRQFGWIEPVESDKFINICSKFERYYLPILIIK